MQNSLKVTIKRSIAVLMPIRFILNLYTIASQLVTYPYIICLKKSFVCLNFPVMEVWGPHYIIHILLTSVTLN